MKTSVVVIFLAGALTATAQPGSTVPKNIRAANTLEYLFDANGLANFENLYGIPLEPGNVVGNSYLNDNWRRTTFLLYDVEKMLEGYHSRYEIGQNQFEIKTTDGIKVLNGKKVKSFVCMDTLTKVPHYFINGLDYENEENVRQSGFFEVMTEGSLTLLSKMQVSVKEPTYNEKLDMGNPDTRILKKTRYYVIANHKLKEVPSSRKKFLPLFGEHAPAIETFIKTNKLSLDEASHLKAIFEYYNARSVTD